MQERFSIVAGDVDLKRGSVFIVCVYIHQVRQLEDPLLESMCFLFEGPGKFFFIVSTLGKNVRGAVARVVFLC